MTTLSSVTTTFPRNMRHDPLASASTWSSPEAEAVYKKREEPQDDDDNNNAATSTNSPTHVVVLRLVDASGVASAPSASSSKSNLPPPPPPTTDDDISMPTRASRSQSLTHPVPPPPTPSAVTTLLSTSPPQTTTSRLVARRSRRAMSAEFSLSMLQQELGYPQQTMASTAERTKSRRDSLEKPKSRRTSSILEIDESEPLESPRGGEPEPEIRSSAASRQSRTSTRSHGCNDAALDCLDVQYIDDDLDDLDATDDPPDANFLDNRVASVTGFSQDADGVVYYEIIIRSIAHGPLSAYKVRRRYSEFRTLHKALAKLMPVHRRLESFGLTTNRTGSFAITQSHSALNRTSDDEQVDTPTLGTIDPTIGSAIHALPPLPDRGGVWAYLQFDTTPFLERRALYFDALLVAAQHNPKARASRLLNAFVGPPPDAVARFTSVENSYVSLNRFAAPKLRLSVEAHERKQKARNISRRRSSIPRMMLLPPPAAAAAVALE